MNVFERIFIVFGVLLSCTISICISEECSEISPCEVNCSSLRLGQYICPDPKISQIDPKTQQFRGCRNDNRAKGV